MSSTKSETKLETEMRATAVAAKTAGGKLARLGADGRSKLLRALAAALREPGVRAEVAAANGKDMERAKAENVATPLVKRLGLDAGKLDSVCDGLDQLAAMPDLVGRATLRRELDDGLVLERVSTPLGLLGVIFESRPDALVQIVGLAWKSGNAVLLKGGREALGTNRALTAVIHRVLEAAGIDPRAAVLLEGREDVAAVLGLHGIVEVIVARGSSEFVRHIMSQSDIPVMGHAAGVCHLYVHEGADAGMAAKLAVDGKTTYPAACNATETLLWDAGAGAALDACAEALKQAGVELRADEATRKRVPWAKPATDADFGFEFGANVIAVKQVGGIDDAMAHIAAHGSKHTEAIVTGDAAAAGRFLAEVDAAGIFHNASTRFADGYRYGLGAEVGISTDKLHARGPVGVEGLLTYRWLLRGSGQETASYGPGKRPFKHKRSVRSGAPRARLIDLFEHQLDACRERDGLQHLLPVVDGRVEVAREGVRQLSRVLDRTDESARLLWHLRHGRDHQQSALLEGLGLAQQKLVVEFVRLGDRLRPDDEAGPGSIDGGDTNPLYPLNDDRELVLAQPEDLQDPRGAPDLVEPHVRTVLRRIHLRDDRDELARPVRALDGDEASLPVDVQRQDGAGKDDAVAERQHGDLAHDLDALGLWSLAGQGVILTPVLKKVLGDEQQREHDAERRAHQAAGAAGTAGHEHDRRGGEADRARGHQQREPAHVRDRHDGRRHQRHVAGQLHHRPHRQGRPQQRERDRGDAKPPPAPQAEREGAGGGDDREMRKRGEETVGGGRTDAVAQHAGELGDRDEP